MKRGVSLVILMASIAIMVTIMTTTIIYSSSSIETANFEKFKNEMKNVADLVNAYYLENNELPVLNEVVSSNLDEFNSALAQNGDKNSKLLIINPYLLKSTNIKIGKGNVNDKDIFVVSEDTHNIYYLKGYTYKGKIIFKI